MAKVLHIVENFNGQAIEKWLTLLVNDCVKRGQDIDWTFYCIEKSAGRYGELIEKLGCKVFYSPYPISKPLNFIKSLRKTIIVGKYDIIHSHHDLMSALYFVASIGLPVRKKIIHVHNTSHALPTSSKTKQFLVGYIFRFLCNRLSDHIVGVSRLALNSFSRGNSNGKKFSVIHCAIEIESFIHSEPIHYSLRENLAIPKSSIIMLFVGRMVEYKNPLFVIEILKSMLSDNIDVYAVFVGEGDLIQDISNMAALKEVVDRVKVLGWRNDVREIMAACDVLIFPSLENPKEGLGLTVVEAQSVGLPVVMSLSVPKEAIVISQIVARLPLQAGAEGWRDKVYNMCQKPKLVNRDECERIVRESSFSPIKSVSFLEKLYQ